MTARTEPNPQPLPADLAAVALIDAPTCAAAGTMSVSWWHEKVASGIAPQPAFRAPRCTRWRAAEVAAFWRDYTPGAEGNASAADAVKVRATKASAAAQAKRRTLAAVPTQAGA
jgi:predicted DNA-binding transcriptional regulator AlpA